MRQVKLLAVIAAMPILASCTLWRTSGQHIHNVNAGNVGIGTTSPESKLTVVDSSTTPVPVGSEFSGISSTISSPTNARAIYGAVINSQSLEDYGGYFTAAGASYGVLGEATDPQHGRAGGVFRSYGSHGYGVMGLAFSEDPVSTSYGGWFRSRAPNGVGIYARGGPDGYAATLHGTTRTEVLEITGGADLSEQFEIRGLEASRSSTSGLVVSIDPENPGDLVISNKSYDRGVAGIISGAGGVRPGLLMGQQDTEGHGANPVALSGRVYVRADASMAPINPGDLLTTSDIPGHAMKVTDYSRAQGAILGKAMSALKEDRGLVLVLVTLQ